jgi:hypothetical protein
MKANQAKSLNNHTDFAPRIVRELESKNTVVLIAMAVHSASFHA